MDLNYALGIIQKRGKASLQRTVLLKGLFFAIIYDNLFQLLKSDDLN